MCDILSKYKLLVKNNDDLYELLDSLLRDPTEFWDRFYKDKERNIFKKN